MANYKIQQMKFKSLTKPKLLHRSPKHFPPLNLGIKQFKRDNPNVKGSVINAFKAKAWKGVKK